MENILKKEIDERIYVFFSTEKTKPVEVVPMIHFCRSFDYEGAFAQVVKDFPERCFYMFGNPTIREFFGKLGFKINEVKEQPILPLPEAIEGEKEDKEKVKLKIIKDYEKLALLMRDNGYIVYKKKDKKAKLI